MKFECDSCHAQYMIADEKVGKRGVKVKCKKCQHVIIVRPNKGDKAAEKAASKAARAEEPVEKEEASTAGFDDGRTELSSGEPPPPPPPPADDGTLTGNPPQGLDELRRAGPDNDPAADGDPFAASEHNSFAAGGPTDPAMAAMPPVPGASDEEPESTGNHRAPAPVSMFGDTTQLSAQAAPSEPDEPPSNDRTELGAPPQMTVPPRAPEPAAAAPPANEDLLSDQLSGAFSAMFDAQAAAEASAPPAEDDHRGPTRVLDANAVAALRKQTAQRSTEGTLDDEGELPGVSQGPPPDLATEGFVVKPPAGADDGPAEQVWHCAIDEQDVGPLSIAEIGRHIEGGRVDRESLVWKMGMDNWEPAGEVPEIRALFDKVPMPRIQVDDERPRARASSPPDLGGDLADAPQAGRSPFDEAPDDPAWRPHGLTDVYQAANLAEAAAGMGLGSIGGTLAPKASSSSPPLAAQSSMDSEWRPGAASALASLVQDEIKRIDSPLPPADDDLRPADDASINAPIFGGLAAKNDLDAGPEITDPMASRPPLATRSTYEPPPVAPSFPPQPGFQTRPPAEAPKKLSPLAIGGIAGGGLLVLGVIALVVVLIPRGPEVIEVDGKKFIQDRNGNLIAVNGGDSKADSKAADAPKDPAKAAASDPAAPVPATPTAGDPAAPAAPSTVPPAAPADGAAAAPPAVADAASAAAPDKPVEVEKAPSTKKATTSTKKTEKAEKAEKAPPLDTKPPPKGCDPVLDFDCKAGGAATKRPDQTAGPLPDTPSKADVLVVVKSALPKVAACGKKTGQTGMISMQWQISPSGKVTSASAKDKHAGTPTGSCVADVIKALKFPASKKGIPVTFPMKLN